MGIQQLVRGIHSFQAGYFARHRELFRDLAANGQRPHTLFITCSDSRILPNHITGSGPGELFIVRNIGNVIPPIDLIGGTASALQYAVEMLGVDTIVVCGHTRCGAIDAILHPERVKELEFVKLWLKQTERVRDVIADRYKDLPDEARAMAAVEENVLAQLENLRDYDFVDRRMNEGKLHVSGWIFDVESGDVFDYDPSVGEFVPLGGRS